MKGSDLRVWRETQGWTQTDLMQELDIRSRQTIINWEAADKVPRLVELAIKAIDELPLARKSGAAGVRMKDEDAARHRQVARRISEEEKLATNFRESRKF